MSHQNSQSSFMMVGQILPKKVKKEKDDGIFALIDDALDGKFDFMLCDRDEILPEE